MMSKVAVVYWSGTGNTEQMAAQVAEGVRNAGGETVLLTAAEFGPDQLAEYYAAAFAAPPWVRSSWRRASSNPCSLPVSLN